MICLEFLEFKSEQLTRLYHFHFLCSSLDTMNSLSAEKSSFTFASKTFVQKCLYVCMYPLFCAIDLSFQYRKGIEGKKKYVIIKC